MMINESRRSRAHFDLPLVLLVFGLAAFGVLAVSVATFSTSSAEEDTLLNYIVASYYGLRQSIFFLISPVIIGVITYFPYEFIRRRSSLFYFVACGLLLITLVSNQAQGVKAWTDLIWGYTIQPSEFVKILLLWVLSAAFAQKRGFKRMIPALAFAVAMCLILLIVQRDLGTLLIYFFLTIGMFYAATSNLMLTGIGLAGGCVGAVGAYHLFDHVKTRVDIWINPWSDTQDKGYQIVQALIAISSGGLFGLGLGLGTPRMIPYYHTDFIFAAICEEFGIIFAVGMLALYCFLIMRGLRIALEASTAFHSLMALGATLMLAVQTFIIVGGVTKMIPLTGVTLPFASAGGSSLISCMAMIGILLGVSSLNRQERARALNK